MTKITAPIVQEIRALLLTHLDRLHCGYTWITMRTRLSAGIQQVGTLGFSYLDGLELQPDYPLDQLLLSGYDIAISDRKIILNLPGVEVKRHNQLVTDFVVEAMLLSGDLETGEALRLEVQAGPLFSVEDAAPSLECSFEQPCKGPWMLLLKVSCFEGSQLAMHPKHYGFKIVAAG